MVSPAYLKLSSCNKLPVQSDIIISYLSDNWNGGLDKSLQKRSKLNFKNDSFHGKL